MPFVLCLSVSCPAPVKNRDFVIQSSWLQSPAGDYAIINHSVFHRERPGRKGFVRGTSFLTGRLDFNRPVARFKGSYLPEAESYPAQIRV